LRATRLPARIFSIPAKEATSTIAEGERERGREGERERGREGERERGREGREGEREREREREQ